MQRGGYTCIRFLQTLLLVIKTYQKEHFTIYTLLTVRNYKKNVCKIVTGTEENIRACGNTTKHHFFLVN
jgi:hypothetical protein